MVEFFNFFYSVSIVKMTLLVLFETDDIFSIYTALELFTYHPMSSRITRTGPTRITH